MTKKNSSQNPPEDLTRLSKSERAVSAHEWRESFRLKEQQEGPDRRRRKTVIRAKATPLASPLPTIQAVPEAATIRVLLNQEGVFLLEDILTLLPLVSFKLKHKAHEQQDAWRSMGIACRNGVWLVNMPRFKEWYLTHAGGHIRYVAHTWDANQLLHQQGSFYLIEVCSKIPFTTGQVRHQTRKYRNPKKEMGVWKEPSLGFYVVEMVPFSAWIRKLWFDMG